MMDFAVAVVRSLGFIQSEMLKAVFPTGITWYDELSTITKSSIPSKRSAIPRSVFAQPEEVLRLKSKSVPGSLPAESAAVLPVPSSNLQYAARPVGVEL